MKGVRRTAPGASGACGGNTGLYFGRLAQDLLAVCGLQHLVAAFDRFLSEMFTRPQLLEHLGFFVLLFVLLQCFVDGLAVFYIND